MSKKEPVIWIISHYAGGPSYCPRIPDYLLAKYLQARGYKPLIFASSYVHNTTINFIKDKTLSLAKDVDGVPFVMIRTRNYDSAKDRILNMLEFYFRTMKAYKKYVKPDLVIAAMPTPSNCLAGQQIAKHFNVPYITSIVDLWPLSIVEYSDLFSNRNPIIQALYVFEKWIYRKSDALVFTWEGAYDYIIDKGWNKKIPREKFHYINIGVELDKFYSNLEQYQVNDPDLETDRFTVMYCGSVREANDIGTVVECAKLLCEESLGDSIQFVIYGDGPDREVLEEKCKKENIGNVIFKGYIEKKYIPFVLSKSDLNILNLKPSSTQKYGNSSNKLFEYFAAGNPVVANIDEGKYPIITKYHCGVVVKPNSPKEYAEAVKYFYSLSKDEKEKYKSNALSTARLFDTETLNCQWKTIIDDCLGRKDS